MEKKNYEKPELKKYEKLDEVTKGGISSPPPS